jgi:hypothetical protein
MELYSLRCTVETVNDNDNDMLRSTTLHNAGLEMSVDAKRRLLKSGAPF